MKLVGVILAGGKSTRMGRDKALLPWLDSESLLRHQVATVGQVVGRDFVYVSGSREGFNSVPDRQQDRGPLEGVKTILQDCVRKFSESRVLFVPVDMPFLTRDDLNKLIRSIGNAGAVTFHGMNLPVFIGHPVKALEAIRDLERDESPANFSFQRLYQKITTVRISGDSESRLININTPEDLNDAISKTNTPA